MGAYNAGFVVTRESYLSRKLRKVRTGHHRGSIVYSYAIC